MLSTVYEHYIDENGNKFFTSFDTFNGLFIRQIQIGENCIDSSAGKVFADKMLELGFVQDKEKLFTVYANHDKLKYRVNGSNNGIANNPISL